MLQPKLSPPWYDSKHHNFRGPACSNYHTSVGCAIHNDGGQAKRTRLQRWPLSFQPDRSSVLAEHGSPRVAFQSPNLLQEGGLCLTATQGFDVMLHNWKAKPGLIPAASVLSNRLQNVCLRNKQIANGSPAASSSSWEHKVTFQFFICSVIVCYIANQLAQFCAVFKCLIEFKFCCMLHSGTSEASPVWGFHTL